MKKALPLLLFLTLQYAEAGNDRVMKEFVRRTGVTTMTEKELLEGCDGAQRSMTWCAEYHFIERDLELNDAYRDLKNNLEDRDLDKLVAAQRAWIAFRDRDCAFAASDVEGGSMHPMMDLLCKREMTEDRIARLKHYAACTSVRGTCPPRQAR
jgi:uncharacterized protein YecT (DUF1311 family)